MAGKITTRDLEQCIFWHLQKLGTYLCFEVMIPRKEDKYVGETDWGEKVYFSCPTRERVDLLTYTKRGNVWKFYELKASVSDFHSKAYKSFYGHYNYYVMPREVWEKVKDEIPEEVGVYVPVEPLRCHRCECVKKPKRCTLKVDHDELFFSFMQALSNQFNKFMYQRGEEWLNEKAFENGSIN